MRYIKYSLIAALALSGALSACDDESTYAPGQAAEGDEVYFSLDESDEVSIPAEATSVTINVNRLHSDDQLTVDLGSIITDADGADASGIFSVPSSVTFDAGSKVAAVNIGVDFSSVVPDAVYDLTLQIEGDNTTPYGASKRSFALSYAPWSDWELYSSTEYGVYTMTTYTSGQFDVPVWHRNSLVNPDNEQYAISEFITDGYDFIFSLNKKNTIEVDGVECPIVAMQTYLSPLENGGGSGEFFLFSDVRTWGIEMLGYPEEQVDAFLERNNLGQSYFNPETGLFSINMVLYSAAIPAGAYYAMGYEYLQLPGFANYDIMMSYSGNFVNAGGDEYAIVNATKTEDVSSYVYDIFKGALTDDLVEQAAESLKAADGLEQVTDATRDLMFTLAEDGDYTVVAVGYDSDNAAVCTASYTFTYKTVKAEDPWSTLGYCEYTDGFICSMFTFGGQTWDVEIQENTKTPGLYRLVNPYAEWPDARPSWFLSGNYYMVIHAENPDQVYIEESSMGVTLGQYGEFSVYSLAANYLDQGAPESYVTEKGVWGTLKDGVITFPTGSLLMGMGSDFYYANTDPNNPANFDETIEFDRTWGEGLFCVDMSALSPASGMRRNAPSAKTAPANLEMRSNVTPTGITPARSGKAAVDSKAIREYRLSHPSSIR